MTPRPGYGTRDGARDLERAVAELEDRLPRELAALARLVFNYRWTWMPGGVELFRDLEPHLWARSACNPRAMLQSVPPRRLRELASDGAYVERVAGAAARLEDDLARPPAALGVPADRPVVYLCSEFGAHCSLPLYGGGLGVLAGDVLKTASDLALPLVGVGLLYREGYFHQRLDVHGWQHEYWTSTEFEHQPAALVGGADGRPLRVEVPLRGRRVLVQVWRLDVGRVPLYLLDSNVPDNHPIDRWITTRLYIGDRHTRLTQYAVLGVGGVRALEAMGIAPGVFHLNEGHAALGAYARMAPLLAAGLSADEALERVRADTVFTTHTPVAAGNEGYAREEAEAVLRDLRDSLKLPEELFYGLGSVSAGRHEPVSITPLALRTSRAANGVSRRHGEVARHMWRPLWPDREPDQVPIGHVTNGVHVGTWMAEPMQALLDRHLGAAWRERTCDPAVWEAVHGVPDAELWEVRHALSARLVDWARERSVLDRLRRGEPPAYVEGAANVFDPDHLTLGFARRVATYKRLHLLTRQLERGLRLLGDERRPIQLVIAGKAHPQDQEAKETLRALMAARHAAPHVGSHIVFLEDYDLHQAPRIVAGVDVWLNLPRPPLEASGTSGMKVALNGGLNLSVLDGWWEEAYDGECGWGIASPEAAPAVQDDRDATALFNLLENEVIPLFYERGDDGIPHRWLARVKTAMARLIPRFNAERMLREYAREMYATGGDPA